MKGAELILSGAHRGFVVLPDGRLFDLPVRAAAAGMARRVEPRRLSPPPGRVVAAGAVGRWSWVAASRAGGLSLALLRPDGSPDFVAEHPEVELDGDGGLGAVHVFEPGRGPASSLLVQLGGRLLRFSEPSAPGETIAEGVLVVAATLDGSVAWLEADSDGGRLARLVPGEPLSPPERRELGPTPLAAAAGPPPRRADASESLLAWCDSDGGWHVAGARLVPEVEPERVVGPCRSPVRGALPGLVLRDASGELRFLGPGGEGRRTEAGAPCERAALSPTAPWLLELSGLRVTLRELGPRWGRRLARWQLPVD